MISLNIRIDKWLWMVRLFKTRSMATDACNAGKVKLNGSNVKPSKEVKTDEVFHVRIGQLEKCVQVIDVPKSRVGAPLVLNYYTDLTSEEEYERVKNLHTKFEYREHGEGRPTKRERRQIEYLKEWYPVFCIAVSQFLFLCM
jgi:ribosome-associated heat shock protein Hsp15